MFKRNAVTLALVLILAFISGAAIAQTSPTIPTGGGSAKRILVPGTPRPTVTVVSPAALPMNTRMGQSILARIRAGVVSPWTSVARRKL